MKSFLLAVSLLLLLSTTTLALETETLALHAAESFISMIDDGNLQAVYWAGSPLLQLANNEHAWIDEITRAQLVLGKARKRTLKKVRPATSPPRFPDDDYRIVYFETETAHKIKAAEVLYLHQVSGLWKVCYYSIR